MFATDSPGFPGVRTSYKLQRRCNPHKSRVMRSLVSASLKTRLALPKLKEQGINREIWNFLRWERICPCVFARLFRGLRPNSLLNKNREFTLTGSGKEMEWNRAYERRTGKVLNQQNWRSCSAQSNGMAWLIRWATLRSGRWRPSRIAICRFGDRKASGSLTRM